MTVDERAVLTDALLSEIGTAQKYNALVFDLQAEIQSLRSRPCPYVTGTVTKYCTLTPLTLTDAEREAVKWALGEAVWSYNPDCGDHPDTLRRLLTRMSL